MRRVRVVDSHTEGEPTRVVLDGGPDLGSGPLAERRDRFRAHHDDFRRAVLDEPRGSDALVGALLVPPEQASHATGVVFFNNVGYLGMCGHGTIGVVATLAHLGRIDEGPLEIDTPAGPVAAEWTASGSASVRNVVSYRARADVRVEVPGLGRIRGDVAWGGNWFFLTDSAPLLLRRDNVDRLTALAIGIRDNLARAGVTGTDGAPIDHVEFSGPAADPRNSARNFVLCPGGAYDRSPCGTGTSALLACRFADGRIAPGERWRQEGILGTVFDVSFEAVAGGIRPTITGRAYVTAESELLFDDNDPFARGLPS